MQTGQNSIAPENSFPQLGQVRWASVLMALPAVEPQSESTRRFSTGFRSMERRRGMGTQLV
jgi:hypothetical protein